MLKTSSAEGLLGVTDIILLRHFAAVITYGFVCLFDVMTTVCHSKGQLLTLDVMTYASLALLPQEKQAASLSA